MKESKHNILSILKLLAFVSVICAMFIQPAIQSLSYLDTTNFELADMDAKKDSNEKENLDEDSKDEKVELQVSSPCYLIRVFVKKPSIFSKQNLKWDFTFETHLPPPEQV
jgi:hypothetical protein